MLFQIPQVSFRVKFCAKWSTNSSSRQTFSLDLNIANKFEIEQMLIPQNICIVKGRGNT